MATIAILVSRVEALCLADMLNAEGIAVHIVGYCHGTVEVIPLALGGYRITVPESQWEQASELVREAGVQEQWHFSRSARRAARRVFGVYVGILVSTAGAGVVFGTLPFWALLMSPLAAIGFPLSPQARGDYFLVERSDA
ncbi:hypothetical protein K3163_00535 [Qipengyuania sp. 1NDW9]|uniref:hypothetical protein n=1 Tax=Qipengyuania xiapuensis TaxID=2867236 RepID=UPI001C88A993|nr:hypothetical protein [Qipengyuania xiapuensis]MBX7491688.1 hypothetical protein [Qipengyuania xiapuensis]